MGRIKSESQASQSENLDEEILTQTQASQLGDEEMKRIAGFVANFFLSSASKKVPTKRNDILKVIPKEHSRRINEIICKASDILTQVYGYNIVELKRKGTYSMVNTLDTKGENHFLAERDLSVLGLRTFILSLIMMNGGVVSEGTLKLSLRALSINLNDHNDHEVFGNMQKVFQDFSKQGYIDIITLKDVEPPTKEYRWGERSHLEVNKLEMLEHVCKVYGDQVKPEMWMEQYDEATKS